MNNPTNLDHLPDDNKQYADSEYWNRRYERELEYDWFVGYPIIKEIIFRHVKTSDKILHLGCGNSPLSLEMWSDGFKDITNVDYSQAVIKSMQQRTKNMEGLKWLAADITHMTGPDFHPHTYDVIVEKGTLDALLVGEVDPWVCSVEGEGMMDCILKKVSSLLKVGGRFMSITFAQPHFRVPLYALPEYQWGVQFETIGKQFHYYCYVMTKGQRLDDVSEVYRVKYLERRGRKCNMVAAGGGSSGSGGGGGGGVGGGDDDDNEFLSRISENI